ncbi:hypothetical protein [Mangrovibacterium sp.]|uniref:hypothetical protein n=1 Tax=Mangrovibacterium sp. TaxID=1961364 RepID=UPI0035613C9E
MQNTQQYNTSAKRRYKRPTANPSSPLALRRGVGGFFEQDTIPGQLQFDFFGNPEEFEEIRKEFEQHFDQ